MISGLRNLKRLRATLRRAGASFATAMFAGLCGAALALFLIHHPGAPSEPSAAAYVAAPSPTPSNTEAVSVLKKSSFMREPTGEIPSLDGGEAIVIPVGQGRIVRFDEPAESVFVGDPSIADVHVVAPDVVYIFGKRHGNTNLLAISKDEDTEASGKKIQVSSLIRVMTDAQPASDALRQLEPSNAVKLSFIGKRATAKGKVKSVPEAVDVAQTAQTFSEQPPLNNTTISGSQQVNIRIRFAEIQRGNLQSFGIDWHVMAGNFSIGVINTTALGSSSSGSSGLGIRAKGSNFDVSLLVEALERNGLVTILAEPNLTAMTGQTANFLAGGEIPVPIPQPNSNLITVEYKPFGVALNFTPTLIGRNRIALRVHPEVSSLSSEGAISLNGFSMPSFTVRRADTTVELASGQSFAIAGLFQRQMTRDLAKFPVLGDIPVLGQLFQSEKYQRNETELVILITPVLVEPVQDRLATPLDPSSWAPAVEQPYASASLKDAPRGERSPSNFGFILK